MGLKTRKQRILTEPDVRNGTPALFIHDNRSLAKRGFVVGKRGEVNYE